MIGILEAVCHGIQLGLSVTSVRDIYIYERERGIYNICIHSTLQHAKGLRLPAFSDT